MVERINGGLSCSQEYLERQRLDREWRPESYYKTLAERFRNREERLDAVWSDPRPACWEIIDGWYRQTEQQIVLLKGRPSHLEAGRYDLLATYEDSAILAYASSASDTLHEWRECERYCCPLPEQQVSNHEELVDIMMQYASKHWIAEMYVLFVMASDCARCHIVPWDYSP